MLLIVSESLNTVLINLVTSFIMSEKKIATPGFSKMKVLWNKGCEVINYVHGAISKILLCGWNYVVNVFM